ncbi:MAG: metallophosphoesterase [Candidatus Caldarchaeum sp.]
MLKSPRDSVRKELMIVEGHPALLVEKPKRAVVVADLHLGFEMDLRLRGVRIPSHSGRLLEELKEVVKKTKAEQVIVAGDLKHNILGPSELESKVLPQFLEELNKLVERVMIIPGNHDGRLAQALKGLAEILPTRGMYIPEERLAITHGHVKPDDKLVDAETLLVGHLHPVLTLGSGDASARLRVWLRLRASRKSLLVALYGKQARQARGMLSLLIMPSFNPFLQGRSVNDLGPSRLVRGPLLHSGVFDVDMAEVMTLDGKVLGRLGQLRKVL